MKSFSYIFSTGLAFFFLLCAPLIAQEQKDLSRPKIGLVLSGGGAKGIAHIGVLKVLEEAGIPIDYIGGTSMGSLVGGLYAAGYSVEDLEQIVRTMDWEYMFSDEIDREKLSFVEKKDRDRFILSFPLGKEGITLPEGIIRGQRIENKLSELCIPVHDIDDFSKLAIPFLCIATDINSGEKIVLRNGSLPKAMRASMAIPSLFVPMEIGKYKLVDGGLIDNFPVTDVLDMGADIIIGVDVSYQTSKPEKEHDLISIMKTSMFMYSSNTKKESLNKVDILIKPDLRGLGTASFYSTDSLIEYGRQAAMQRYSKLKALADSLNMLDGGNPVQEKTIEKIDSIYISSIEIKGLKHTTVKAVIPEIDYIKFGWVQTDDILKSVNDIYSTNFFNAVTFDLEAGEKGSKLIYNLEEKTKGLFSFGFYYDIDQKSSLFVNTSFYNKLFRDTRMSITAGLGRNPGVEFQYIFNKGPKPAPGIELSSYWTSFYSYSDSTREKLASFNYSLTSARIYLRSNFSNFLDFRIGGEWSHAYLSPNVSLIHLEYLRDNYFGLFAALYSDTYNHPYFPDRGHRGTLEASYVANPYLKPIKHIHLFYRRAIKIGNYTTLMPSVYGGFAIGDSIPVQYRSFLGGLNESNKFNLMPFIGYKYFETGNNNVFFGRLDLRFNIHKDMYVTFMANAGVHSYEAKEIFKENAMISGYGVKYSIDTPVGPACFSLMRSGEKKKLLGYFQFGYWF